MKIKLSEIIFQNQKSDALIRHQPLSRTVSCLTALSALTLFSSALICFNCQRR